MHRLWILSAILIASATLVGCIELRDAFIEKSYDWARDVPGGESVSEAEMRTTQLDQSKDIHQAPTEPDAAMTAAPRKLRDRTRDEVRDISLEEILHLALENNPIIRTVNEFPGSRTALLANTDSSPSPSSFDPAIQATNVLFGRRGVEAALADFDATLTTTFSYGNRQEVQNRSNVNLFPGQLLDEENAIFQSRLEKQFATGARLAISQNWDYSDSNVNSLFESTFTGNLNAEFRQPLMAGAGIDFTRIAGPIGTGFQTVTGLSQGVLIARINEDISLADFEQGVRDLMQQTENLYWDFYLTYRRYDLEVVARNSAARNLRRVEALQGLPGGNVGVLALARENYFDAQQRTENALADLYQTETRLRRLVGLPVNDGQILRPSDQPITAAFEPDWAISLAEALTRRVELRRQQFNIKSLALQAKAAKSLIQPRFDLVTNYQLNALGDELLGQDDNGFNGNFRSAVASLTEADEQTWNIGFEMSMPLGFRTAHTQVRNLELRLAKARKHLKEQELEISHELAEVFQRIDRFYNTSQTAMNRREASIVRVEVANRERELRNLSPEGVDLLLRADISVRDAEISFYANLIEYTKAISDLHYRKGTLLEFNNIHLSEGPWKSKAYQDAFERALERTHAVPAGEDYRATGTISVPYAPQPATRAPQIPTPQVIPEDWMRPGKSPRKPRTPDIVQTSAQTTSFDRPPAPPNAVPFESDRPDATDFQRPIQSTPSQQPTKEPRRFLPPIRK